MLQLVTYPFFMVTLDVVLTRLNFLRTRFNLEKAPSAAFAMVAAIAAATAAAKGRKWWENGPQGPKMEGKWAPRAP